jgi:predicted P-loop ATPase
MTTSDLVFTGELNRNFLVLDDKDGLLVIQRKLNKFRRPYGRWSEQQLWIVLVCTTASPQFVG